MTDKQQQAHNLYFHTGKTQQEIADILDVHRHTVRSWIKKNRWDEMKAAARQMPSLILQNIYDLFTAVNDKILSRDEADRCPSMEEVEKLRKLLAMTRSIEKKHTGSYIEAFQELQLFIFNRDSALAMQLREHIADYARGTLGDKEFMARKRRKDNVLEVTAKLGREELRAQKEELDEQISCHHKPAEGQNMEQPCIANVTPGDHETHDGKRSEASETREFPPFKNPENSDSDIQHNVQNVAQKSIENVQFCTEKVQPASTQGNTAKVFTVAANGEITPPKNTAEGNKIDIQENCHTELAEGVTFATAKTKHDSPPSGVGGVMTLPPHMRPSPFIDGDTVWIIHPDHLESKHDTYGNKWGPMKMNYTIRYYPDLDPANTKAA